jgi:Lrp/AsnC family transcriptional regulator, leucine-responsive regulatory protein
MRLDDSPWGIAKGDSAFRLTERCRKDIINNVRYYFIFIGKMTFDSIDYKLIEILQQNARITQMELASEVGLSQPAVAERLRKLETEGIIIAYTAQVDARKLGKDITAFIGVGISHPRFNNTFAARISAMPEVLECHKVTGKDSYFLKIKTENTEKLDELISVKLHNHRHVLRQGVHADSSSHRSIASAVP